MKIAAMADAYQLPVTLHDCTGPVVLTASTHLSMHLPNAFIQEMVRAFYYGWYKDLVTELPQVENGCIRAPVGAGLGTELQPGVRKRPDCIRKETKWSNT
jgi:L-alanine-DL-glutamate epimerase-like enolase superfamily enzyme